MQLATSQRPQPPPVPPRPSRQVVAEALKRTVRPPCPTRQAPPPPNTRPWRMNCCEKIPLAGRTVVYESVKERQINGENRSTNESQRPIASTRYDKTNDTTGNTATAAAAAAAAAANAPAAPAPAAAAVAVAAAEKTEDRSLTPATSERNEAHRERQQQQQSQLRRERCDRENSSTIKTIVTETEIHMKTNIRYDDNELIFNDNRVKTNLIEKTKNTKDEILEKKHLDKLITKDFEIERRLFENSLNENIRELTEIDVNDDCVKSLKCFSLIDAEVTRKLEKISSVNIDDKVFETLSCPDETISREANALAVDSTLSDVTQSGSTNTISSDDCATVVVVDETERKNQTSNEDSDNIHHQDWLEAGIRYSSTKITLPAGDDPLDNDEFNRLNEHLDNRDDDDEYDEDCRTYVKLDYFSIHERIAMSSLQGLPPLPRSLSGFNLSDGRREVTEPPPPPTRSSSKTQKNIKSTHPSSSRPSPPGRQLTTLDTQLAILRKEMFGLRQLDLSLLSQLWSLNESIQEFRQLLQEQEDRAPSPSPSSEEGDDNSYINHPPPPPRRPAPLLHHHRPPRPPRPLRPPASDESPSSEEYGAV